MIKIKETFIHKRMLMMLVIVGILFGGIFGFKVVQARMMQKYMKFQMPPAVVTAIKSELLPWQPQLKAVASLRAVRGVDVTSEIAGLVRDLNFKSGETVSAGQVLVQLNADADIAQLHALQAAAELAKTTYERDKKQFEIQAVSQATLDAEAADLRSKEALVAQQQALIDKKTIKAPFGGRLGISTVNPGQYVNPGDKIVTLQELNPLYVDFYLPEQELSRIAAGQPVIVKTDAYGERTFSGKVTVINPRVDVDTRNFQVEAVISNPRRDLLPGMYATVEVRAGKPGQFITVPQTAVTYNPYGDTVYVVVEKGKGPDGKPFLEADQTFVTIGPTRGDQVAILAGVKEGELVVTSGQLKLRNGSPVVINNAVQPANEAAPKPENQ